MSLELHSTLDGLKSDLGNLWNELCCQITDRSVRSSATPVERDRDRASVTRSIHRRGLRRGRGANCGSSRAQDTPEPQQSRFADRFFYQPVIQSLGWNTDRLIVFRALTRSARSAAPGSDVSQSGPLERGPQAMYQGWDYRQFLQHVILEDGQSISHPDDSKADRHQCYLTYGIGYQALEAIGPDLLQRASAPSNNNSDSIARLDEALVALERRISSFAELDPCMYDQYLAMVMTVNSISQPKMDWLTNLLAVLSVDSWEGISHKTHEAYLRAIGSDIIDQLRNNQLVDLLCQSDRCDLILTTSYLFPIMKMLFCVFGFSKAIPNVVPEWQTQPSPQGCHQGIFEYIAQFGNLYPNLISLMGGTDHQPHNVPIRFSQINPSFLDLTALPEYLWRFNDYAYCCYLKQQDSAKVPVCRSRQINDKVMYLKTL